MTGVTVKQHQFGEYSILPGVLVQQCFQLGDGRHGLTDGPVTGTVNLALAINVILIQFKMRIQPGEGIQFERQPWMACSQ